ncbi:MAG TPA: glycine--tRNA ligase subunit beta [Allosphingosinicella sp.]|nr:glycine--tRNA ligase subunit beta [Allosphingosinicella sp.]
MTVAVSLADKLDTLGAFYIIGEEPTGSKDPYALRRAALGAISLIVSNGLRLRLGYFLSDHMLMIKTHAPVRHAPAVNSLKAFFADRLKVQQREAGIRHDLIDAIFSLEGGREDDLVRLLARVKALQAFVETPEGADLLAGYKRAANILKKEGWPPSPLGGEGRGERPAADSNPGGRTPSPTPLAEGEGLQKQLSYTPLPEEAALISALDSAEPKAAAAVEAEDFGAAMAALASLRAPVDAFFDKVTVNDPDPAKRAARLNLLARMRAAVHRVADFSRIEG